MKFFATCVQQSGETVPLMVKANDKEHAQLRLKQEFGVKEVVEIGTTDPLALRKVQKEIQETEDAMKVDLRNNKAYSHRKILTLRNAKIY